MPAVGLDWTLLLAPHLAQSAVQLGKLHAVIVCLNVPRKFATATVYFRLVLLDLLWSTFGHFPHPASNLAITTCPVVTDISPPSTSSASAWASISARRPSQIAA